MTRKYKQIYTNIYNIMATCTFNRGSNISLSNTLQNLTQNSSAQSLANSYGLSIQNVSWEDTARFKGSCWGPNITDMTLDCDGKRMPVIRRPNMADLTCDVDSDKFSVSVGNEKNLDQKTISLREFIQNIAKYTDCKNNTDSRSTNNNLWLSRDDKLLLSSQACILPLQDGEVEFSVKLYNYQSSANEPAVLVILASSEGTSCQIVSGSENLYFNHNGQAYNFKASRLEDDRIKRGVSISGEMTEEEKARNVLYIYQIPLKVEERERTWGSTFGSSNLECAFSSSGPLMAMSAKSARCCLSDSTREKNRGFDHAMIGKGKHMGKYKGTQGKTFVRDDRYPIRLTLQYYYVSDTTVVSEDLMRGISTQLEKSYLSGQDKGSLVVGGKTDRITEPKIPQDLKTYKPIGLSAVV
jgi:hypothetical protein